MDSRPDPTQAAGDEDRLSSPGRRRLLIGVAALLVFVAAVALVLGVDARRARGDEAASQVEASLPTPEQTNELLEDPATERLEETSLTDPEAAQELPKEDLNREEALELTDQVFGAELEGSGELLEGLEPTKFLSDYAAIVPASELSELASENGKEPAESNLLPQSPVLLESSLPLRTESDEGQVDAVDLSLESPEGSAGALRPENPLIDLEIPAELGEGIALPDAGVEIEVVGAPESQPPSNVGQEYAFYPNVAENTDLIVSPLPTGVETLTQIRSPEAPRTTRYRLSFPEGDSLQSTEDGGAEVVQNGHPLVTIPAPTATDAAGNPVPVEMEVDGAELSVSISPDTSTLYPILVDPAYIPEDSNFAFWGSSMSAWAASTTNTSYMGTNSARWAPGVPGLDLTSGYSGPAYSGTHADWSYWVPRYSADISKYGSAPTTYILQWNPVGIFFMPWGNTANYPALVMGLVDPSVGWAPGAYVHYGGEGEMNSFENWAIIPNYGENPSVKGADMNLVTYENEPQAKLRDTYLSRSVMYLVDPDRPTIKKLTNAMTWTSGPTATIPYEFEDKGLGVRSAGVRLPGQPAFQWAADFNCAGTSISPCPRTINSTESGRNVLTYAPNALPTGIDSLEVTVGDPTWGPENVTSGVVTVKVDNTAPQLSLSGPLTEQDFRGTLSAEYPLSIEAEDGDNHTPQSGVAKVEVKVDGKKITMPNEAPWNPNCATQNCQFSGTWTLKAAEFAAGNHEVEVVAKDVVGQITTRTLEIELGKEPLQTSIRNSQLLTSSAPSYTAHEISWVDFKASREGKEVAGASFKCMLDGSGEVPTTPCNSHYVLPDHLEVGWHTLLVAAVDPEGHVDPTPAKWNFNTDVYAPAPVGEKLLYPESGKTTGSYYTLQAEWISKAVTGVTFQIRLPGWDKFHTVPSECTIDTHGREVSWPLQARSHPGHTAPVYLKVRGCAWFAAFGYPEKEIQLRAVFDGSPEVAGATDPAITEFAYRHNGNRVPTDATEAAGPAFVDLLTGAFTLSRTDVSIPVPGYDTNLEVTRTYSSSAQAGPSAYSKVLGGAWQPSTPLESEFEGEAWSRIVKQVIPYRPAVHDRECWDPESEDEEPPAVACEGENDENGPCPEDSCVRWVVEEEQPQEEWIELINNEGASIPFEIVNKAYVAPEYANEFRLTPEESEQRIVLAYPNGTHTTFVSTGPNEWVPKYISFQASDTSMRMVYETISSGSEKGRIRLAREIAPTPAGITPECGDWTSPTQAGCRTLSFSYCSNGCAGGTEALSSVMYFGPLGNMVEGEQVAKYSYEQLAGSGEWVLAKEWDPRLQLGKLFEKYSYTSASEQPLLSSITPPGQQPWEFSYYTEANRPAKLKAVGRAGAATTLTYETPVSGAGAPYAMGPASVETWGQADLPVNATAVFPPTHVPSQSPPTDFTGATIHYLDPEGHEVNTVSPSPPGVSGAVISTTETDVHGNVVRELSPQNRLEALKAADPAARARELDSHSVYSLNGVEMRQSWGPLHSVRRPSGEMVEARQHTTIEYDKEAPAPPAGTPPAYLPTKETTAAYVPSNGEEFDARVTETKYNWGLRKPKETIVDPTGLNIRTFTDYNGRGQVSETRQPKSAGADAGTTKTIYYAVSGAPSGCESEQYVNLPCKVMPAAQAQGTGRPKILVKTFKSYGALDEPVEIVESPDGGTQEERKTTMTYDEAGRQLTRKTTGGGTVVPTTKTEYDPNLGMPVKQLFVCETECGSAGSFQSAFGKAGTGNGQFIDPADVAIDSKGNIWVADKAINRIEEFSESGEFLRVAGSEGSTGGKLKAPSAVSIDASNNVWVADTGNNRIAEFNEKGEFIAVIGTDVNKTKVEAGGTALQRRYCSAASGNVCQAGPEGTASGQLKAPQGIAATSGGIWVADTSHSRIEKYSATGEVLSNSFSEGSALGQLKAPTALTIASNGSLWVADTGNNRIEHWSSSLTSPAVFGTEGAANGQFKRPSALEVDSSGNVWVGDEGNSRVEKFTESGTFKGKFGSAGAGAGQFTFEGAIGLAIKSGNLWITDPGHAKIQKWAATDPFDTQATTVTYDNLGRPTSYEDADGNKATTKYDVYGRPVTKEDAKGSQTLTYDPASGLPTKLEDSGAGTFTAAYNANGQLVERSLPNGLTAKTTLNAAGEPTGLSYTKTTFCGESCTWLQETLQRSISGQILSINGTLVNNSYSYDKAGRLVEARETPTSGSCTTRAYAYDLDSNRLSKTSRSPGIGGVCATSGGEVQKYEYDAADRLEGPTYDGWGRITYLQAQYAGGKALATSFYSTDMIASQTQGTVTNSFELDASLRQRARLQGGGLEGTEIFHYDSGSDSPAWTERGATWTRNVSGLGGGLVAVQSGATGISFQLTNLHGDVVAVADPSPSATKLKETLRFDEFGNPMSSGAARFGWLGGKQRRTELPSGVMQMGVRSYVPSLGRFLTPDPVFGGSANPYDYANQDPVNLFDLSGEKLCNSVHHHQVCAATASRLHQQVQSARKQFRREAAAAQRTAAAQARHHPSLVIQCNCSTSSDRSGFESFVEGITGSAVSFGKGVGGDIEAAVPYQAASDAFKMADGWSPGKLVQLWQCGWALSEGGGKWKQQCDPWEYINEADTEAAR